MDGTNFRRRRLRLAFLVVVVLIVVCGVRWPLPSYLKDVDGLSRASIAQIAKLRAGGKVDEIYGLLHLVTAPGRPQLSPSADVNSGKPIPLALYDNSVDWTTVVASINERFPVVVFSKTHCPYSQRAKALLDSYELKPAPAVIEVDLRDDSHMIKVLLTRLTGRSTFPNVIVGGKSIGGYDEINRMHENDRLGSALLYRAS